MENSRVADLLDEIADLLELKGANEFRIRSYQAASRTVRSTSRRLQDMIEQGESFETLPNVGVSTAGKIREILDTGTCKRLEELRAEWPQGLIQVMGVEGIGPRKAMKLYQELGVQSLEELQQAAAAGRIQEVEGFGEKSQRQILRGIQTLSGTSDRILYSEAVQQVESLRRHLAELDTVKQWEIAGSYRRGRETVGDLDVLVLAEDRMRAATQLSSHKEIAAVISQGSEKLSVRLQSGLQVDFRFCDAANWGAAVFYFTGSKDHNIAVRRIAQEHDWKLNEYGLFSGEDRMAGKTEQEVYAALGLQWIPPELREDRGEVEAARQGTLPVLVDLDDIRGDFQSHTVASDGSHTVQQMADAARKRGYSYLAITDHSKRVAMAQGLDDDRCLRHADEIRSVDAQMEDLWVMAGIEVDILQSGTLDLKHKTLEQLDWVVGSIHYDRRLSEDKMTDRLLAAIESGVIHCLAHPLGRIIGRREPLLFDTARVFESCVNNGVFLEINAQPDRLDLPDTYCQEARSMGAMFTLGSDAHSVGGLGWMGVGINVARRAWLQKEHILNTVSVSTLRQQLERS